MTVRIADPFNLSECQQQLQRALHDRGQGVDLAAARKAILAGGDAHLLDLPSLSCPLHMVISTGSTEGLNFLLDQGVDPIHVLLVARPGQLFETLAKDPALQRRVWDAMDPQGTMELLTDLSRPQRASLWRYGQGMVMQQAWTSWLLHLAQERTELLRSHGHKALACGISLAPLWGAELEMGLLTNAQRSALDEALPCPLQMLASNAHQVGSGGDIGGFVLSRLERALPSSSAGDQAWAWSAVFSPLQVAQKGRKWLAPLLDEIIARPALLTLLQKTTAEETQAWRALCGSSKAAKLWHEKISPHPLRELPWVGFREMIEEGQLGALKQYFSDNPQPPEAAPGPSALGAPQWQAIGKEIALHWPLKTLAQALDAATQSGWPLGLENGVLEAALEERGGSGAVTTYQVKRQMKALSKAVPAAPRAPRRRM